MRPDPASYDNGWSVSSKLGRFHPVIQRKIVEVLQKMSNPWIFMGIDRSHFSAKLRSALRYKQIHHVEYPPDPKRIAERTGVGFIPVLFSPEDEVFQDTTDIIDMIEARFPKPALIPSGADGLLCRLVEVYADEFFPTVSMRTRRTYPENVSEMRRAFAAFTGDIKRGDAAADLMSSYLPMLGVTDETKSVIDDHADELLGSLDVHLAANSFLLGERLSLADCALLGPLYAHLYLDRVTRKKLYDEYIHVCMWIERCNRPVPEQMGNWFDGDYPQTLQNVLGVIGRDAAPLLLAMDNGFEQWALHNAEPGQEAPRLVGEYSSTLRGAAFTAGIRPYVSWKIQRLRDHYAIMSGESQHLINTVLSDTGCDSLMAKPSETSRLEKAEFRLLFK